MSKNNTRARILARNALYKMIRDYFHERDVLEVETPQLARTTAIDCHLHSYSLLDEQQRTWYLQTSPELAMKKCLAAGSGAIFQLCKAFRVGEVGKQHHPEFTMLEWYRPGLSFQGLIDETLALLHLTLSLQSCHQVTYRQCFSDMFAINPHQASLAELKALVEQHTQINDSNGLAREDYLDLLITEAIKPYFQQNQPHSALILTHFPACQAAMSKVVEVDNDSVCRRFEIYINGIEIANGYDELTSPVEQRARLTADCAERVKRGLPSLPIDEDLLAAMTAGLGEMTGIALGVDRLLMLQMGATQLVDVLSCPDPFWFRENV